MTIQKCFADSRQAFTNTHECVFETVHDDARVKKILRLCGFKYVY